MPLNVCPDTSCGNINPTIPQTYPELFQSTLQGLGDLGSGTLLAAAIGAGIGYLVTKKSKKKTRNALIGAAVAFGLNQLVPLDTITSTTSRATFV